MKEEPNEGVSGMIPALLLDGMLGRRVPQIIHCYIITADDSLRFEIMKIF